MNILNFSHPLTEAQVARIAELVGQDASTVRDVKVQFDLGQDFVPQVASMLDGLGVPSAQWQSEPWLIVLPSLNYIAAVLLAELHARMGHFPTIVRLKPKAGALVTEYEVAEVLNLEQIRQQARARR